MDHRRAHPPLRGRADDGHLGPRQLVRPVALSMVALLLGLVVTMLGGLTTVGASAVPALDRPTAAAAVALPAVADTDGSQVELVLFWGDGCPHCAAEKEWLAEVEAEFPGLRVTAYEVWYDEANRQRFVEAGERLGFEPSGVPTTIIGDQVWVGFSDATADQIRAAIEIASAGGEPGSATASGPRSDARVDVPLVGDVQLADKSLVVSTLIIGFVDGINPCSLWVISVLLTIVVRTGSRGRVLAIGSTFLLVTAGMYAVYMAGIYSAMTVMAHLGAIQLVVALTAGIFGIVSVKDYFAFKKGLSFTIPDSSKPGIYRRIRAASGHQNLLTALAATVLLAVGVSLLETPCTAGFPVLWTGMLAEQGVGSAEAVGLFGLYMAPFLVDELVVFGIAVATMRAAKMQERHGELLKLVAGTTMLALAGTMLVRPETMEDPLGALLVFVAAFAAAALVHGVTTRLRASGRDARPSSSTGPTSGPTSGQPRDPVGR